MTGISRVLFGAIPVAFALAAATPATALAKPEGANFQVAHGLVCDTPEEVRAFVASTPDKDVGAALDAVNARFGKDACGILTAVLLKGDEDSTVLIPEGIIHIVRIEIFGVLDGRELVRVKAAYAPVFEPAESV